MPRAKELTREVVPPSPPSASSELVDGKDILPSEESLAPSNFLLNKIFEASNAQLETGLPFDKASPAWQLFLLGDGAPTKHVKLMTGKETAVDVFEMSEVGSSDPLAPECLKEVKGPYIRRQVWLKTGDGERYGYAVSWWNASEVNEHLKNRSIPIWQSLRDSRTETYRDVRGESERLEREFGFKGPFWGRYYIFWHSGRPMTVICEVFSPLLDKYFVQGKA